MPSELEELFRQTVKKSNADIQAAKKDVELEKLLKDLDLTNEQYKQFLAERNDYRPSLYDVNLALDDKIVGEYKNRLTLFTLFILAKNNIYVSGPSAGGKTSLMEACIDLMMPHECISISGSSEKAIFDMSREIAKSNYVVIPEINKVSSNIFLEVIKSWGERATYTYRRSGGICSGMQTFVLDWKPFVFSRADESANTVPIGAEVMSRLTEITVDGSSEQTSAVIDRKAEQYENPFEQQQVDMVERTCLKYHISNIPVYDECINPAAKLLKENIPCTFTTARRTFPIYKQNADGIARFHWKDRLTGTINDKSVIFVTPADMFINHLIFGDKLIESALRCNSIQKTIMQIITNGGSINKQDIQRGLHKHGINATGNIVKNHIEHLTDMGYVDVELQGKQNYYTVSNFYATFDIRPDFSKIIEYAINTMESVKYYKSFADEYVERFCKGDGLNVVNPFDGEVVNILDYNWKSVLEVSQDTRIKKPVEVVEKPTSKMSLSNFF